MTTATAASAGVPAFRRKAWDETPAEKNAAGVVYVSPEGEILLLRRSFNEANFAGHWALPGGGVDAGETPLQGAARESREEMGTTIDEKLLKTLDRRITPTGLAFTTFAAPVADKFAPRLNDEHIGYTWTPLDHLPGPLHPAVEQTLKERVGVAADMTPEDWTGLREGFAKWTREEEVEEEHRPALDAALRLALDESVRSFDADGRMKVSIANISKACVSPYKGSEIPDAEALGLEPNRIYHLLRDPDELAKAAATFNEIQLLKKHIPVDASDHQPDDIVGTTGTQARFEFPYLKNSLSVWAADAISAIEDDEQRELSCAYRYRADMTPGIFHDTRYDGVMRDIVGNHVALVKDGRAGPDVVVGDSRENLDMASKHTRLGVLAMLATSAAIRPLMAHDAKPLDLGKLMGGLTTKNFAEQKPAIIKTLKGVKLAKDSKLDAVLELVDAIGEKPEGMDDAAADPLAAATETATNTTPIATSPDYVADAEPLKAFLKEKGMDEESIKKACDLMPKALAAEDEEDDDKKDKKDMVTQKAMDSALKATAESVTKTVRATERGIRTALSDVRPWVGELSPSLAMDSAADVYRHTAKALKVEDADTLPPEALWPIIKMMPKAGAKPAQHQQAHLAQDARPSEGLSKMIPGLDRIQVG